MSLYIFVDKPRGYFLGMYWGKSSMSIVDVFINSVSRNGRFAFEIDHRAWTLFRVIFLKQTEGWKTKGDLTPNILQLFKMFDKNCVQNNPFKHCENRENLHRHQL